MIKFKQILTTPTKIPNAFNFEYTSIDASRKYLACGANDGTVHVFRRMNIARPEQIQLVKTVCPEFVNGSEPISCVKLSVCDRMLAVGTNRGTVAVIRLNLEDPARAKFEEGRAGMRSYETTLLNHQRHHAGPKSAVTALVWDYSNGRLFSGGRDGQVVEAKLPPSTQLNYAAQHNGYGAPVRSVSPIRSWKQQEQSKGLESSFKALFGISRTEVVVRESTPIVQLTIAEVDLGTGLADALVVTTEGRLVIHYFPDGKAPRFQSEVTPLAAQTEIMAGGYGAAVARIRFNESELVQHIQDSGDYFDSDLYNQRYKDLYIARPGGGLWLANLESGDLASSIKPVSEHGDEKLNSTEYGRLVAVWVATRVKPNAWCRMVLVSYGVSTGLTIVDPERKLVWATPGQEAKPRAVTRCGFGEGCVYVLSADSSVGVLQFGDLILSDTYQNREILIAPIPLSEDLISQRPPPRPRPSIDPVLKGYSELKTVAAIKIQAAWRAHRIVTIHHESHRSLEDAEKVLAEARELETPPTPASRKQKKPELNMVLGPENSTSDEASSLGQFGRQTSKNTPNKQHQVFTPLSSSSRASRETSFVTDQSIGSEVANLIADTQKLLKDPGLHTTQPLSRNALLTVIDQEAPISNSVLSHSRNSSMMSLERTNRHQRRVSGRIAALQFSSPRTWPRPLQVSECSSTPDPPEDLPWSLRQQYSTSEQLTKISASRRRIRKRSSALASVTPFRANDFGNFEFLPPNQYEVSLLAPHGIGLSLDQVNPGYDLTNYKVLEFKTVVNEQGVEELSPSELCGMIQPGDILVGVNGHNLCKMPPKDKENLLRSLKNLRGSGAAIILRFMFAEAYAEAIPTAEDDMFGHGFVSDLLAAGPTVQTYTHYEVPGPHGSVTFTPVPQEADLQGYYAEEDVDPTWGTFGPNAMDMSLELVGQSAADMVSRVGNDIQDLTNRQRQAERSRWYEGAQNVPISRLLVFDKPDQQMEQYDQGSDSSSTPTLQKSASYSDSLQTLDRCRKTVHQQVQQYQKYCEEKQKYLLEVGADESDGEEAVFQSTYCQEPFQSLDLSVYEGDSDDDYSDFNSGYDSDAPAATVILEAIPMGCAMEELKTKILEEAEIPKFHLDGLEQIDDIEDYAHSSDVGFDGIKNLVCHTVKCLRPKNEGVKPSLRTSSWPPAQLTMVLATAIALQQGHLLTAGIDQVIEVWLKCFNPLEYTCHGEIWREGVNNFMPQGTELDESRVINTQKHRLLVCDLVTLYFQIHVAWPFLQRGDGDSTLQIANGVVGAASSLSLQTGWEKEQLPDTDPFKIRQWEESEACKFINEYGAYLNLDKACAVCNAREFEEGLSTVIMVALSDPFYKQKNDELQKLFSNIMRLNKRSQKEDRDAIGRFFTVSDNFGAVCLLVHNLVQLYAVSTDLATELAISKFPQIRPWNVLQALFLTPKWASPLQALKGTEDETPALSRSQKLESKIKYHHYLTSLFQAYKVECSQDESLVQQWIDMSLDLAKVFSMPDRIENINLDAPKQALHRLAQTFNLKVVTADAQQISTQYESVVSLVIQAARLRKEEGGFRFDPVTLLARLQQTQDHARVVMCCRVVMKKTHYKGNLNEALTHAILGALENAALVCYEKRDHKLLTVIFSTLQEMSQLQAPTPEGEISDDVLHVLKQIVTVHQKRSSDNTSSLSDTEPHDVVSAGSESSRTMTILEVCEALVVSFGKDLSLRILGKCPELLPLISLKFFQQVTSQHMKTERHEECSGRLLAQLNSMLWSSKGYDTLCPRLAWIALEELGSFFSSTQGGQMLKRPKSRRNLITTNSLEDRVFSRASKLRMNIVVPWRCHWGSTLSRQEKCVCCDLPTVTSRFQGNSKQGDTSAQIRLAETIVLFPCGHIYHQNCINNRPCIQCTSKLFKPLASTDKL